jgi:hypothetical protein
VVHAIRRLKEIAGEDRLPRVVPSNCSKRAPYLDHVEDALRDYWNLGRNLILAWSPSRKGIDVLIIPHYALVLEPQCSDIGTTTIQKLLAGPKRLSATDLEAAATLFPEGVCEFIAIPTGVRSDAEKISELVERFGISYAAGQAVLLFDIVGFSRYSPLEQATQLNSLSYSINSAHARLLLRNIEMSFASTTTGDGFYIWSRDRSKQSNVNLYNFMHLVLADNAIARVKSRSNVTPSLRTAFHVGSFYEYHRSEGISPTTYTYIVGNVTIELARMMEHALPGQIVVGDFQAPTSDGINDGDASIDAKSFMESAQSTLSSLEGLILSGDAIDGIKCYLTGQENADGTYLVTRYRVTDKHGFTRYAFNAKVNIYRGNAAPIFLGIQDKELGVASAGGWERT